MAGRQARCPSCKNLITVPTPAQTQVRAAAKSSAPRPTASQSSSLPPAPRKEPKADEATFEVMTNSSPPETSFAAAKKAAPLPRSRRPADDDDDPPIDRNRSRKRANAKKSEFPWMMVSVIGGVAAVMLIGVLCAIAFMSDSSKPAARKKLPKEDVFADAAKEVGNDPHPLAREKPAVNVQANFQAPKDVLPHTISNETLQRVKKSTAHIRITSPGGDGEGSGFFALERGLVVSNAHVVGMLHSMEKPKSIEVTVNSGEPDEYQRNAVILGVDQDEDLALLRLDGDPETLPPPLLVDHLSPLAEVQNVYIFGFPLGVQLGKNITVSNSAISSIRKNKDGSIHQIQVNGGMQPGNSGGPVVDARGNVIGVSVSIIRGTQINFAVPGEKVHGMVQGRVQSTSAGEPYRENADNVRIPVKIKLLDPLTRLKAVKLDVWTAPASNGRPNSNYKPTALPGDGPKKTVSTNYFNGQATTDLLLPQIPAGHVLWVQPVLQQATGQNAWSNAFTVLSASAEPLKRIPANLTLNMAAANERTIDLTSKKNLQMHSGGKKMEATLKLDTDIFETVQPNGKGDFVVTLHVGKADANNVDEVGQKMPANAQALRLFKNFTYRYVVAPQGRLVETGAPDWTGVSSLNQNVRHDADELASMLSNSYEASSFNLPQRETQPMEIWTASAKMLLGTGKMKQGADVNLTCTYEGIRVTGDKKEAFIRISGELQRRSKNFQMVIAKIDGHALVDLNRGYFSKVHNNVRYDLELGNFLLVANFETTMTRTPGNPRGITPAPPPPPKGADPATMVAKGKVLLNKKGQLLVTDPSYPEKNSQHQVVPVAFVAGKTYLIDLMQAPGDKFDPFLVLEDPTGAAVEKDDDGAGKNLDSRIVYTAKQTGPHRIIVTAFQPIDAGGSYVLRVVEFEEKILPKEAAPKAADNPKAPPGPAKGVPKGAPKDAPKAAPKAGAKGGAAKTSLEPRRFDAFDSRLAPLHAETLSFSRGPATVPPRRFRP
jgi:S1-C subfamily serine protease